MFFLENKKYSFAFIFASFLLITFGFHNCAPSNLQGNSSVSTDNSQSSATSLSNNEGNAISLASSSTSPAPQHPLPDDPEQCNSTSNNCSLSNLESPILPNEIVVDTTSPNCWLIDKSRLCFTNLMHNTKDIQLSYLGKNELNNNYKMKVTVNSGRFSVVEFNVSEQGKLNLFPRSSPHFCFNNPKANTIGYCDLITPTDNSSTNCISPVIFYGDFGKGSLLNSQTPPRACGVPPTDADLRIKDLPGPTITAAVVSAPLTIDAQKNNCITNTSDNRSVCFFNQVPKELKIISTDFNIKNDGYYLVHLEAPSGRTGRVKIKVIENTANVAVTASPYLCFDETKDPCAKVKTSTGDEVQNCSSGIQWQGSLVNGKSISKEVTCSSLI
ncbi:MAG: hypothetical protein ACXVCY_09615 [Pseudobdellovibrionaceae bacterium]